MSFDSFAIDPALLAGVRDLGFEQPTDIQQDAIPWGLEGRDVLACAMTGSGKTAAFGLPILQRLLDRPRGTTRALILSPTRELALQIEEHLRELAVHTDVRVATIHGGVAYEPQERAIREGFDILVATPGRLLDLLRRPYARLDGLEVLVLDEADRMLDMGFIPDVRRILAQVPAVRQTLFFSATLPQPIVKLAGDMLTDPVTINLERRSAPAEGVRQSVYPVRHELKASLLLHLLQREDVESALVFTRTKERADLVGEYLRRAGIGVAVIHGDRTQQHRSRAMNAFKEGKHRVLVATDVAARGIDVEDLSHVVNLDVPDQPDDYIHRVGRTARAGATGDAWTFVAARELAALHLIEKSIGKKLERVRLDDFDYSGARQAPAPAPAPAPAAPPAAEERPGGGPAGRRSRRPAPAPVPPPLVEREPAADQGAAQGEGFGGTVGDRPAPGRRRSRTDRPAAAAAAQEGARRAARGRRDVVDRFAALRERRQNHRLTVPVDGLEDEPPFTAVPTSAALTPAAEDRAPRRRGVRSPEPAAARPRQHRDEPPRSAHRPPERPGAEARREEERPEPRHSERPRRGGRGGDRRPAPADGDRSAVLDRFAALRERRSGRR